MNLMKRIVLGFAMTGMLSVASPILASAADNYPQGSVNVILGSAPGGANDVLLRLMAGHLEQKWKQPVVVVNQPGASASIAATAVAQAKPDGLTLDFINNNHTLSPNLMKLSYDPIKSFEPIIYLGEAPMVLVANTDKIDVNTLQELVEYARGNPGDVYFGSCGLGCPSYLNMKSLMDSVDIDMVNVSYNGGGPVLAALLGGEVDIAFMSAGEAVNQLVPGSKLRALGVSTLRPALNLPDVPTIAEALDLPDYDYGSWYGFLAPAGTTQEIVAKIYQDVSEILEKPEVRKTFEARDVAIATKNPEEFRNFLESEIAEWGKWISADAQQSNK